MIGKKSSRQPRERRTVNSSGTNKNVFSYYSNRAPSEETRPRSDTFDQKTKSSNRNLKYIPTFLAIFIIVISVGYSLLIDTANPKVVLLSQESSIISRNNDYYEQKIADILQDSMFNKSKVTLETAKIEKQILEQIPELEDVAINIPLVGKRLVVQVSQAKPKLILHLSDGSYVVGANGKVLMKLSELPDNAKKDLINVEDTIINNIKIGDTVIPVDTINFIDEINYQLNQKGMTVDSIKLPAIANELHAKPRGVPYEVRFNLQGDAREQIGTLLALIEKMNKDGAKPIEYIDVRVSGRAYYK